ncbi:hypothetical protein [Aquibium oceanicum]|uniref:Uncharacterized protein n=1 Tax=Aquibium oceanicum TaxID=1670800 RepID=A0A1L3SXT7_9HYPH|nr:hypothetical protein [Aquibium oceanicum]APH74132.1 hypothetical protein BSQ44_24245 [Aquibium oceanicum]
MTQCYIQTENDDDPCICDDCGETHRADELDMVTDIEERISPGEIVPAGQCPSCGALAHLVNPPEYSAQARLQRYEGA